MADPSLVTIPTDTPEAGPRVRRNAKAVLLSPDQFEDATLSAQQLLSSLSQNYSLLHISANEMQVGGGSGGSGRKDENDVGRLLERTEKVRRELERACTGLANAGNSINAASSSLVRAEEEIDEAHPISIDPATHGPKVALAKRQADKPSLIDSYERRAREVRSDAEEQAKGYERKAATLRKQIADEARQVAEAKARALGRRGASKGQRKRARAEWVA